MRVRFGSLQKRFPAWIAFCLVAAVCVAPLVKSPHVFGASYGSGPYGVCRYQSGCSPSTTVTLPAGSGSPAAAPLQVNINLANGQIIPRPGYTVIVTPLNGQGTSFQEVQFYINGQLVHTQAAAENGTARWFWDVTKWPGTTIKVVVIGKDGQTVTKTFHVVIGSAAQNSARTSAAASASILQRLASVPGNFVRGLTHAISHLPPKLRYGLPYFLFLVLICDILILLYRTRQEVAEAKRLQALLTRERQIRDLKHTFVELVSHYLRTPLTIISGGIDLAGKQESAASSLVAVRDTIKHTNRTIDDLITQLSGQSQTAPLAVSAQGEGRPLWRQPNLYIPLGLTGFVVFSFDYLARHSQDFSIGGVNLIVQLVLFISLGFLAYHTLRQRRLKSRESTKISQVLAAETAFNTERDELISISGFQIKKSVDQLAERLSRIEQPEAREFTDKGLRQFQDVVDKLLVANELKGTTSTEPYVSADIEGLVQASVTGLEDKIAAKTIQLKTGQNMAFKVQNAELLAVVLRTILDNAIAYSGQGGSVEVSVSPAGTSVTIGVTDHGQGIAADKQYSLFQAFSKTEGAETFNHEGMGFSLFLDKLIMNYLVGDISVESVPKQGTKVLLTLPQPV